MTMGTRIIANMYRDSVALMKISSGISLLEGVTQASCIMGDPGQPRITKRSRDFWSTTPRPARTRC